MDPRQRDVQDESAVSQGLPRAPDEDTTLDDLDIEDDLDTSGDADLADLDELDDDDLLDEDEDDGEAVGSLCTAGGLARGPQPARGSRVRPAPIRVRGARDAATRSRAAPSRRR